MLNISYKKSAVNFLNKQFNTYINMKNICSICDNDVYTVTMIISKVIKYALLNYNNGSLSLSIRDFIGKLPLIDIAYASLSQEKKGLSFFKKASLVPPYALDSDIDLLDLPGLILPDLAFIEKVCADNKQYDEILSRRDKEREEKLDTLMGFKPTAFNYVTEEIVYLNEEFNYDGLQLTGDVITDFRYLYNDERYEKSGLLNRKYSDNLTDIINARDISLFKKGSLYFISNGRHRILYLLARGNNVAIRASVSKRIENERLNDILLKLQEVISFEVFKANPYSDDEVICIIYKGNLYELSTLAELEEFASSYDTYPAIRPFVGKNIDKEQVDEWVYSIVDYCTSYGLNILEMSFCDLIEHMGVAATINLYEAYLVVGALRNKERIDKEIKELDKEELNR